MAAVEQNPEDRNQKASDLRDPVEQSSIDVSNQEALDLWKQNNLLINKPDPTTLLGANVLLMTGVISVYKSESRPVKILSSFVIGYGILGVIFTATSSYLISRRRSNLTFSLEHEALIQRLGDLGFAATIIGFAGGALSLLRSNLSRSIVVGVVSLVLAFFFIYQHYKKKTQTEPPGSPAIELAEII